MALLKDPYVAGGVAAAATALVLYKTIASSPTHKNGLPLPPGPPAKWLWENPFPEDDVARRITPLFEQYGPVVSLRSGSHVTIVIGRMEAATELMEKEGASLVDRPRNIAAGEILSGGMRLIFSPAGDLFRRLRRTAHTHLQPKAAETYQEIQSTAAKDVILDILNDPKLHAEHARRYSAGVILRVTYGKSKKTSIDDPEVVRVHQVGRNFRTVVRPGAYLVDRIPWLKHVPGYDRQLQEFHQYELSLFRDQLNNVRKEMASNDAGPSFGRALIEHAHEHGLSENEMVYLAGSFFGAGADTTACGISVMIMAATLYPDAQARVQEELDEVIGRSRLPTFADKEMLPQVQAFVQEAMRWRPIVSLGFAHRATKDIIWRGQCIPAGATVLGCHWAISRDPDVFPDPETFNPQRWLTEEGTLRTDMHFFTYGFGRRICPGMHVASRSLFINLAYLLWSFQILEKPGSPVVETPRAFINPVVFRPDPFDALFVPRVDEGRLRELMMAA